MLEECRARHARVGAKIYAEVAGYRHDRATPISSPRRPRAADGAFRSMRAAMKGAVPDSAPGDVQRVNAHGTSTSPGRRSRTGSQVERLFHGDAARSLAMSADAVRGRSSCPARYRRGRGDLLDPGDSRSRGAADVLTARLVLDEPSARERD